MQRTATMNSQQQAKTVEYYRKVVTYPEGTPEGVPEVDFARVMGEVMANGWGMVQVKVVNGRVKHLVFEISKKDDPAEG